jgi:hypothetical protein
VRPGADAPLAADRHAELLGLEDARRAARADVRHERVRDLAREVLLEDEPVRERVDELHDLAEPDDPAARQVRDVRDAARRQQVVRADGVEVDPGDGDEVPPGARDGAGEDLRGFAPVPVHEVLEPRLRDAPRGVGEVRRAADPGRQPERVEEPLHRARGERGVRAPTRRPDRLDPSGHPAPGT